MNKKSFHAKGKLLITGEYLVMQGALALAVPTKFGQGMHISSGIQEYGNTGIRDGVVEWRSYYEGKCWFEGSFSVPDVQILRCADEEKASFLLKLLTEADKLNPETLKNKESILVETQLDFNPEWGLGSSSTLISMVADWFETDPYQLFNKVQEGSAYDIACANSDGPLWYRLILGGPVMQGVVFRPEFHEKIAFVYSGKKQDSATAITAFNKGDNSGPAAKERISQIGRDLTSANDLHEFNGLVDEHENIMSEILGMPKIKERAFPDFPGSIKSLGAWGGDFLMASSEIGFVEIKSYFSSKGLHTAFSFDEMILGDRQ